MTAATLVAATTAVVQPTSQTGQHQHQHPKPASSSPSDVPTTRKSQIDDPSAPLVHPWHWHGTQDYGQAYKCLVCDDGPPARLLHLRCGHYHCTPCLQRQLGVRVADPIFRPVRCCSAVDIDTLRRVVISPSSSDDDDDDSELYTPGPPAAPDPQPRRPTETEALLETYAERYEEWAADLKLYCHDARCSAFIPVAARSWHRGTCPRCRGQTCVRCGAKAHPWLLSCLTSGISKGRLRRGGSGSMRMGGGRRAAATEADVKLLELAGQKGCVPGVTRWSYGMEDAGICCILLPVQEEELQMQEEPRGLVLVQDAREIHLRHGPETLETETPAGKDGPVMGSYAS